MGLQDDSKFGAFLEQPAAPETFSKAQGGGESIINILEVCESDFASNLAKEKTQEAEGMDKTASEYSADRETTSAELSAVNDYYAKIKDRCIAKPETYAARTERRAAEIAGLKEALSILEDETALVQRKKRSFRGTM